MTNKNLNEIVEKVKKQFGGRDPIAELNQYIQNASPEELRKIIMLSTNRIGEALKGGEYETAYEAAFYVNLGAEKLLSSYKMAIMSNKVNTNEVGTA